MSEPNSKLFRDDPAAYYAELGANLERERIVKLLEEAQKLDFFKDSWAEAIELIKGEEE